MGMGGAWRMRVVVVVFEARGSVFWSWSASVASIDAVVRVGLDGVAVAVAVLSPLLLSF